MTKVLFDVTLSEQEFGTQALSVRALKTWAGTLPATLPDVEGSDVVQIEALLNAIGHGVGLLYSRADTHDVIQAALKIDHMDAKARGLIEEGCRQMAIWKLAGAAQSYWRERIEAAVAKRELLPIDSITMQPIGEQVQAPAQKYVKGQANIDLVLNAIATLGFVARSLPKHKNGARNSSKSKILKAAMDAGMSKETFRSTWQKMRAQGLIAEASE